MYEMQLKCTRVMKTITCFCWNSGKVLSVPPHATPIKSGADVQITTLVNRFDIVSHVTGKVTSVCISY